MNFNFKASVMQYLFYCCNELEHHISGWVKPTQQTLEGCNPGTVAKSKALALNHLKVILTDKNTTIKYS